MCCCRQSTSCEGRNLRFSAQRRKHPPSRLPGVRCLLLDLVRCTSCVGLQLFVVLSSCLRHVPAMFCRYWSSNSVVTRTRSSYSPAPAPSPLLEFTSAARCRVKRRHAGLYRRRYCPGHVRSETRLASATHRSVGSLVSLVPMPESDNHSSPSFLRNPLLRQPVPTCNHGMLQARVSMRNQLRGGKEPVPKAKCSAEIKTRHSQQLLISACCTKHELSNARS